MIEVWRLVTARYAESAFSGDGARLYGGRWNRKGVPVVYTSDSQALAMLEMLVQDDPLRARYVMIPATIPEEVADRAGDGRHPARPLARPGESRRLRTLGTAWARRLSSAVLAVPSAVIPDERNYLLNPQHEAFSAIEIGEPREFVTDLRLLRKPPPRPVLGSRLGAQEEEEIPQHGDQPCQHDRQEQVGLGEAAVPAAGAPPTRGRRYPPGHPA